MNQIADNSNYIEAELSDVLTLELCSTLVSELIKFILYRKQQLPYTFDRLKYLITMRNSKGMEKSTNSVLSSIERQFKVAENGLTTLELLFEKTKNELADSRKGCISEVALVFGSTPMTPKQVYVIHLPEVCLNQSSSNHTEKKRLFHLLQSVILSNNFTTMLTKPMNPTNMYVFIKKNKSFNDFENNLDEWFVPKTRYEIPKSAQFFHIKFRHPTSTCSVNSRYQENSNFKIYSDSESSLVLTEIRQNSLNIKKNETKKENFFESKWYQACEIFKGFTDVYINGVSVADLWLKQH